MIARAETAVSNYGDRCPSLGRRAKTNKRVPSVVLDCLLLFLLDCLLHENSRSQAATPTRRFVNDSRTDRSSPAGRIDSKMRRRKAIERCTIKRTFAIFSSLKNMYEQSITYNFIRSRNITIK